MTSKAFVLLLLLALGGCARTPDHSEYFGGPPSPEKTLEQTLAASDKGPSQWSPAITLPLYPVLLAVDTTIKFVDASYRFLRALFGGVEESPAVPERLERQAEKIQKN